MKLLLISNGNLAREMHTAMTRFYTSPEIDVICLEEPHTIRFIQEIESYVSGTKEEILIACDDWGSTAFNETVYTVKKLKETKRIGILTGMNLPMIFKLYGLKDTWDIKSIQSLYMDDGAALEDITVYQEIAS